MKRGHHDSKKFWKPCTGKELPLNCEQGNVYNKLVVVAVRNRADAVAVGNTPQEMLHAF